MSLYSLYAETIKRQRIHSSREDSEFVLVSERNNASSKKLSSIFLKRQVIPLLLTHGAEPFLGSCQLCSYSRTSQHFMEPGGSVPCSQEPSTGPYPEPDKSNPIHTIPSYLSTSDSSAFLNATCFLKYVLNREQHFSYFYPDYQTSGLTVTGFARVYCI
jgi:hypothetical protein